MFRFEVSCELSGLKVSGAGSVKPGECLAVTGPSGCGKSTLIRMLAGLHAASDGAISIDGESWLDTAGDLSVDPRDRHIGLVAQRPALFPRMSAVGNVAFGAPTEYNREERMGLSRALLADFGLADRIDSKPASLSGGEAARVALARALTSEPHVLLLDEPFASLDEETAMETAAVLRHELVDQGIACILVTHDQPTAGVLCTRALRFDRDGSSAEVELERAFRTPAS